MAVTAQRRLVTKEIRTFGSVRKAFGIPDLTKIQTASYARFLQYDGSSQPQRKVEGLEGVLQEIFPIESYDKTTRLEYLRYDLGKPRYEPDECRQLRLTYGRPFRIWLRLVKDQPVEEEVYLGDLPIMLGGGTGSEVMRRIAAPMVGGIFTSFLMELLIYPCIYFIWKKRKLREKNS